MHSNVWNLKSSKQRLEIIERTQAQKKHLINILSAKSQIDTRKPPKYSTPIQSHILQKKLIEQNNLGMVKRIVKIGRGRQTPQRDSQSLQTLRNLKTYSSLNRSLRLREIEEENSRMFSRLIMTSPTIKRQHWIKRNIQTSKYKENLLKSKYRNPDYSQEAFRIMQTQPKFTCLKLPKNPTNSRFGINKVL